MRICYLADAQSVHTQKWLSYFVNKGYEVHLISFRPGTIKGVSIHYVQPIKFLSSKLKYLSCLYLTKKIVHHINPDIIHAHWASTYGLAAAYTGFHPFIVSAWGSDILKVPKQNLLFQWLIRYTLRQADFITTTSKALADETRKYAPLNKNVIIIPFGVEMDKFSPIHKTKKEILTIGTIKALEPLYGIDYLIRAFANVARRFQNVQLQIIGRGSLKNKLQQLSQKLGVIQKVSFVDAVPHDEIPKYLSRLDIFVIPSISESFGVVALEAQAMEIPVVASKVVGLPEVVLNNETGLLVPPKDVTSLTDAIIKLIENPDLRKRMGKAGRKFVNERYNWYSNAEKMTKLYHYTLRLR